MTATAPPTREPQSDLERVWWDLLNPRGPYDDGWWHAKCPKHSDKYPPDMYCAQINFGTLKYKCSDCTGDEFDSKAIPLRNPTAWVKGYPNAVEMRKSEAEARRAEKQASTERRRAERKAARESESGKWVEARNAIARFQKAFPDVPEAHLPGRHFAEFCEPLVLGPSKEQVNGDDGWWMGWCPLHDNDRKRGKPTAMYHFRLGSYKCLLDIPCHAPKRGMSIINLRKRVSEQGRG